LESVRKEPFFEYFIEEGLFYLGRTLYVEGRRVINITGTLNISKLLFLLNNQYK